LIDADPICPARALAAAVDEQITALQLLTGEEPADALLVQAARTVVGDDQIDPIQEQQAVLERREPLVNRVQVPARLIGHVLWPPGVGDHAVGRVHEHESLREGLPVRSGAQRRQKR